jgi:undecaprenyl phosphate-alpha-L-ara4FN deformylase
MCRVGLRVDIDTLRAPASGSRTWSIFWPSTRPGPVSFFSVGPDNMGRHLWRLMRPMFLIKMLRTRATSLYGWDILLRGTLWPGPIIGKGCSETICLAAEAGHEIGLHAWDHHRWQTRIAHMDKRAITDEIKKGYDMLKEITGKPADGLPLPPGG